MVRYMIETVITMVIALLIFSYIVDSTTQYGVNNFFSEVKSKISSSIKENVEKIPTSEKIECEGKVKKLIPNVLVLSNIAKTQVLNYWNDGVEISETRPEKPSYVQNAGLQSKLRKGSKEGENINHYYDLEISYSKKIISDEGVVFGSNSFSIVPILKKSEKQIKTDEGVYDTETDTFTFSWEGFDNEMKRYFHSTKIVFNITKPFYTASEGNQLFTCSDISSDEKGDFECKGLRGAKWDGTFGSCLGCARFKIEPDIYDNKIYEIVSYEITSCNWIEV